jgi:hypothetical protein
VLAKILNCHRTVDCSFLNLQGLPTVTEQLIQNQLFDRDVRDLMTAIVLIILDAITGRLRPTFDLALLEKGEVYPTRS